jgi:methyl-accepting chemotaxis protein
MGKQKRAERRKRYFIKRGFQISFILKFCFLVLAGVMLSTGLLFFFSKDTLTSTFQQSRLVIKNTAFAILPAAVYTNLITLGLITAATIAVVLLVSHKIAGPWFRFEKELAEIGNGDLRKVITLRKKDQMAAVADNVNKMTSSLRERIADIQKEVEGAIQTASDENASANLKGQLARLKQKIGDQFKL